MKKSNKSYFVSVIAALLLMLVGCAGNTRDKPQGPPLPGAEIKKLIVGNTVKGAVGAQSFTFYYQAPVSVSGVIGVQGDNDSGTWKIKGDDVYCHQWDVFFGGVERCYQWYKTERGYILENVDVYRVQALVVYGIEQGNPLGF